MKKYGRMFDKVGYGGYFRRWLATDACEPYSSWGNGSAMRVSSIGWWFDTLEETEIMAEVSASVTHNHAEGVKGAQATAAAIFLARIGKAKKEIQSYIENKYGYDLSRTLDEIRPTYKFDASCQGTVPEAIIAFLESTDFEDAIRNAVSLGGDRTHLPRSQVALQKPHMAYRSRSRTKPFHCSMNGCSMYTSSGKYNWSEWRRKSEKNPIGSFHDFSFVSTLRPLGIHCH